jgi:hypothetical protein
MLLLHIVTKWEPVSYNELTIGVPKESEFGEKRVSQSPESVKLLSSKGFVCFGLIYARLYSIALTYLLTYFLISYIAL